MVEPIRDTNLEGIRLPKGWMDAQLSSRAMTARELSNAIGVSQQTLSNAKLGRRISPRTFQLIHQFLQTVPVIFPKAMTG